MQQLDVHEDIYIALCNRCISHAYRCSTLDLTGPNARSEPLKYFFLEIQFTTDPLILLGSPTTEPGSAIRNEEFSVNYI